MVGSSDYCQGAAWLSSARAVRCWLSPATSATPILSCHQVKLGTLGRLPAQAERKEGTTSSHHGPYAQGDTRATMAHTEGSYLATGCQSQKVRLSSDRGLQLDPVKVESLVIAH